MKKLFAILLITALLFCFGISASAETQATLYNYYGDNMLFKQNDDAVFAGKAASGTEILCTLTNSAGKTVATANTVASADGTFSLSFKAPAGSFEEYTATLSANGEVFDELTGVVFGELWLAGGQSNMQWILISTAEGYDMAVNNKRGSSAIRMMYAPHNGTYKGDVNKTPAYPMDDYESKAMWYKGDDVSVFSMTAIGYFFAEDMLKTLNVPIGILDANLGGTSILTWLPRETIENNPQLLADCKSDNRYIPLKNWNENTINCGVDMTANFNKVINPLKNFRLSGMLWYQGEGDVFWNYGRYTRAFNALQETYTRHFQHNGPLPIVFTQLASYSYGFGQLDFLQTKNVEFSAIQQLDPSSRAMTTILDEPLTYTAETHPIHPYCKKGIAEKMSYAAKGLVYGLHDSYSAATPKKVEIKNSSVYVTFRDVGDKLLVDGEELNAFSICGSSGVYVPAKAEIVSADTIRIYSSSVSNPVSAAYATAQSNGNANLYASRNGEKLLPVSPFITDINYRAHLWQSDWWSTCDYEQFWHCHNFMDTGYHPSWGASNASLTYKNSEADTGNALYITSNGSNPFTIFPRFTYNTSGGELYFEDVDLNWSGYKTLSFKVKVKSGSPVHFDGLMLTINDKIWVAPAIKDSSLVGTLIPADGKVHTITLDLDRLYPLANISAEALKSRDLGVVYRAEFVFTDSAGGSAELCFDDVTFGTEPLNFNISDSTEPAPKPSFFERIKAFFLSIYTKIVLFFENLF